VIGDYVAQHRSVVKREKIKHGQEMEGKYAKMSKGFSSEAFWGILGSDVALKAANGTGEELLDATFYLKRP
jgi:hypothetical protein